MSERRNYKRLPVILALQTVTGITLLQVQPMVSFLIRTARNSLLPLRPVSYTHLDVYKRQKEGPAIAEKLLGELGFEQDVSNRIQYLIAHHHTYDNINEIDYQILVEADFLVNIMEDGLSKEAALKRCV